MLLTARQWQSFKSNLLAGAIIAQNLPAMALLAFATCFSPGWGRDVIRLLLESLL